MTRPEAKRLAREMYQTRAWTITAIRDYLAGHGVDVHHKTVKRWADPAWEAQYLERQRSYQRQWTRARRNAVLPRVGDADAIRRRAEALHSAGLDVPGIRIVISVDFGVRASAQAIRHLLATGEMTASLAAAVAA